MKTKRTSLKRGRSHPARSKLDPRFAYLLSLSPKDLIVLKRREDARFAEAAKEVSDALSAVVEPADKRGLARVEAARRKLFTPLTAGVYLPAKRGSGEPSPTRFKDVFFSAFILSDASAEDLAGLGIKVGSHACDVFSAFIPLSHLDRLERSSAVRYIELARLWFYDLNLAVPYAQINQLQNSQVPALTGANVIVGVIDNTIDFYHPDFRTAGGQSRLLFIWDQQLNPQGGETGPPVAPALPGFAPANGTYGVEYSQANINADIAAFNPVANPPIGAYTIVRTQPPNNANGTTGHGNFVMSCAAGNGLAGNVPPRPGAAPGANIIYVKPIGTAGINLAADNVRVLDAFSYIFARATQLAQACVVNLSASDNQGPHDGTTLGEQFLDNLLLTPGRAITLSAGNSNNTGSHASGTVTQGNTTNVTLNYQAGATASDDIEIWYDGQDNFSVTVTVPTQPNPTVIGPVAPGNALNNQAAGPVTVSITSVQNDPRNGDNLISIIITVPVAQQIPTGNWTIALTGTSVINGTFHAWVDRNNRGLVTWGNPQLQENTLTLGVPSTCRRAITVGNHDTTANTPLLAASSGRGPTRDGRIKPELATVGGVNAASPRNMNLNPNGPLYQFVGGTSFSSPLVAGTCALLFQCRGANISWFDLKQILTDNSSTNGINPIPNNGFGYGFMQIAAGCAAPQTNVDVWLRDDPADTGTQPSGAAVFWACPDIAILDTNGNPVANPTYSAVNRFNNIIRVTVRNRGTQTARNVDVFLYWADPGTNIPFPQSWLATGIFTGSPNFLTQGNLIVIPQLAGNGASTTVDFAWAPPPPNSSLAGDSHFCLLVRLEHEADPSNIANGGFPVIPASNNLGLHNVTVQP